MPQIFGPGANGIARMVLWGALAALIAVAVISTVLARSRYATLVARAPDQPVPFSHEHHVGGLGLDCRYCHTEVERSSFAGVPATEVCMTCHSQIWTDAPVLAPVRASFATGRPVEWVRVNDVQDFVYFNHLIHVDRGVGCETCHGNVAEMPLTWRAEPLSMAWCLDCHRDPAPNLRPAEAVFETGWEPPEDIAAIRAALMIENDIDPSTMTDCYVCHR